jgi:hypothetical protein
MFGDPSRVETAAQLSTNQSTVHKQRTLLVQSHVNLKTVPYVEKMDVILYLFCFS